MKLKKTMTAIITLAILMFSLIFYGCDSSSSVDLSGAPDYSNATGEFLTYGYTGPTDGTWFRDDEQYNVGEDFRTVERYKEYKDAGFNVLLLQGNEPYRGEKFETSQLKQTMDRAYEAGVKRVIVFDSRIEALSESRTPIVGEGKTFADYEALVAFIRTCLNDYKDHPAFFGVMLVDETVLRPTSPSGASIQGLRRRVGRNIRSTQLTAFGRHRVERKISGSRNGRRKT